MTAALPVRGRLDPALPALDRLTDRAALAELLGRVPWLVGADPAAAAVRLRWKPGTNVRLGVVVPTADGPAAVLIAAFPRGVGKAGRIAAGAWRFGHPVHVEDSVVVVPDRADPDLGAGLPDGVPLAYNPARRWVGRVGPDAVKVHADAPPRGVGALLADPPATLAPHLPATSVGRSGRVVRSAWTAGHAPTPADGDAVRAALAALHATAPPAALPELDAAAALAAAQRAGRSVAATLPAERARLASLVGTLRRACAAGCWPRGRALLHGDLSPDQVVVTGKGAVLLDLDRAAVGPGGWDLAQWGAARIASGGPALPVPGPPPAPVLVLAAALIRAPEPFRRLHPQWAARTRALLDAAADAARELARAGRERTVDPAAGAR